MNRMTRFFNQVKLLGKRLKPLCNVPGFIILIGVLTTLIYVFSFLFPFTDNAFVVNNVRPVAAQVNGYITDLYIKNGQFVKKGQKLFTVFQPPYRYTVEHLQAQVAAAKATLSVLQTTYERDKKISENQHHVYVKRRLDHQKYQKGYDNQSISLITLQNSQQNSKAAFENWQAALKQLKIDQHRITAQTKEIESLIAQLNYAKVELELTNVYAQQNGVIQNLFFSVGSPIIKNQPLFSLVDTQEVFIQANFNETDLRNVRPGNEVLIFPRMYLGRKMFHGVIVSSYWAANRQEVDGRTQLQNVFNENQWILLPQRLPVMIKVTDVNHKFPLRVGTSAYVYIKTG